MSARSVNGLFNLTARPSLSSEELLNLALNLGFNQLLELAFWQTPAVTGLYRLPAHSPLHSDRPTENALKDIADDCHRSLGGA